MCRWCEPYFDEGLGEMAMRPLPAYPGSPERGWDTVLCPGDDDEGWAIVAA